MADSFDNGPMPPSPSTPASNQPPPLANEPTRRPVFPPLWLPVTLLSLSLLMAMIFVATVSLTETGSNSGILLEAPSSNIITLQSGSVYGLAMESNDGSDANREPPTIDITAPSGTRVLPSRPGTSFDPSLSYVSLIRPPMAGDYSVIIGDAPDGEPMQIVLIK